MHTKPRWKWVAILLPVTALLLVPFLLAPGPVARAGDGAAPTAATSGTAWVYDVRVVRVLGTTPEAAEAPAPWAQDERGAPVVTTSWPDLLKLLKARGTTTLLLDQRVTAVANMAAEVEQRFDWQVAIFDRRDEANEFYKSSVLSSGCRANLRTGAFLEYEVKVNWALGEKALDEDADDDEAVRPLQGAVNWRGAYPPLQAQTLVLTHREQLALPDGTVQPVEFYAFLTGRLVGSGGIRSGG
ncbi:MAG: hypothetical protein ACC662_01205 [Planctomycetota bacterium]